MVRAGNGGEESRRPAGTVGAVVRKDLCRGGNVAYRNKCAQVTGSKVPVGIYSLVNILCFY